MSEPVKQHQVPRSYLERFADADKKIYVFDKQTKTIFQTKITNVAAERNFYDTPDYVRQAWKEDIERQVAEFGKDEYIKRFLGTIKDPIIRNRVKREIRNSTDFIEVIISQITDPKYVEKILSKHEDMAKGLIDDVLRSVKQKGYIRFKYKSNMAFLMAVQYIRTRTYRNTVVEMTEGLFNHIASEPSSKENGNDISVRLREGGDTYLHLQRLLDADSLNVLARTLNNHICMVGVNTSGLPLYTSDNPVVLTNQKGPSGFAVYGAEIALPLTPEYIFLFFEKMAFKHWAKSDQRTLELKEDHIVHYNSLQVEHSNRQVYCSKEEFDLVEKMAKDKPYLFDPNRPRIKIEDIGGDIIKTSSL